MWPWASIFSVERGTARSASPKTSGTHPRACSEDWPRAPRAWETPVCQDQLRAEQLGPGDCPLLRAAPACLPCSRGPGGPRTEDMGREKSLPGQEERAAGVVLKQLLKSTRLASSCR